MKKIIVNENQKGLLFKNGRFIKHLDAGKYYLFGGKEAEILSVDTALRSEKCPIETLLANPELAAKTVTVEVAENQLALHYVDGVLCPNTRLTCGKHVFWSDIHTHAFTMVDLTNPEVDENISASARKRLAPIFFNVIEVAEHQKARLYFDKKFVRLLDAGTHYFWRFHTKIDVEYIDTRLQKMDIIGQEILTADKVTLRVNLVLNYRITDYVKVATEIDDYVEQLHIAAQLALREYVGRCKLDEILENKEKMSEFVFAALKAKEETLFVEVKDAGVKDIILPGEIREIMNTVLVAEKRAQANVITRREEVASTRSLLNTAKLMDENQTLYKLKELEYVERICENVGNITLNGNGDVISQLASMLKGKNAEA